MKKKTHVLFTGPLPPPAGGISIHIWRLKHYLEKAYALDYIDEADEKKEAFFNIHSLNPFTYFRKIAATDLLYIHSGNKLLKKLHIIFGKLFGKKIIVTLHGYGPARKWPFRELDSAFFSMADKIILVNDGIKERLNLPLKKCVVQHAFIPPVIEEESLLPDHLLHRINYARKKQMIIICANASRLDTYKEQDLYGLDMCIEATRKLVKKGFPVYFIFTVSSLDKGADRYSKAQSLIEAYQLEHNFFLFHEKISFVKLIQACDIVIRPTNTDGDALTIREGLFLGKQVLASDVVERPSGTLLFKTRNQADLENKLETMLLAKQQTTNGIYQNKNQHTNDDLSFYYQLIDSVMANCGIILKK
jgi:hypothetical protein